MKRLLYLAVCCSFFIAGGCGSASYLSEISDNQEDIPESSLEVVENEVLSDIVLSEPSVQSESSITLSDNGELSQTGYQKSLDEKHIFVQITGSVQHPGVYELNSGSRLFQVVDEAGGYTENADITSVNGASVLIDGQNIYVYSTGETEALRLQGISVDGTYYEANRSEGNFDFTGESAKSLDGLISINTADKNELMNLPGIGELRAEAIITYRNESGGFKSIEDIKKVSGIKDSVFSKIKDKIKV